jgi:hypothetical protein
LFSPFLLARKMPNGSLVMQENIELLATACRLCRQHSR